MTHDLAIVGGGLVGASLAIALAPSGKRVALIEAAAPPKSQPNWDERCIALNVASRRIYEHLGLWPALRAEAEPITATHISERGRFGVTRFSAEEVGEEALGWNVPVRHLGAVLWSKLGELPNFTLICPGKVDSVVVEGDSARLGVIPSEARDLVQARLIVACDGAQSAIRTALGIGAQERDYQQVAIVGAVRAERPHQGVAYERFLPGGPLAIIPKPDGRCGVIWTVPAEAAPTMLAWSDAEFLAELQTAFGMRLGRFLEVGKRNGHPLSRVMSDALTAPRVIFAGNAAQSLHPVAAQGFNLGLRDVATVAELAGGAEDPGASELLDEYARRRAAERETVAGFTDGLVRIFSNSIPGLAEARHWGLLALDLLPPLKRAVMRQNLGFAGGTPAVARK
jgi:2-octaprenyl-6-methoxyphenol hydroxylase